MSKDEELFAHLFDVSPFPAVLTRRRDHTIVAINQRTAEIFQIPQDRAIGRRVTDYYVDPAQREELATRLRRDGLADNVRVQIKRQNGGAFWALVSARLVTCDGEPAVLTVFNDISEQLAAERALKASEQRLVAQSNALTGLTARYADPSDRFDERLRHILEVSRAHAAGGTAQHVALRRASAARSNARACINAPRAATTRGRCCARHDAPAYFDALERERVIAANDARTDPRTREFLETYLTPNGIGAMLDVPLRQNNMTVGVLCAEHVGAARAWTVDEQNFAISTANLIVVAVADEERRQALTQLAESEARARLVVDTAHDAFIGMDSAGRIVSWNAQAENTFGWTAEEARRPAAWPRRSSRRTSARRTTRGMRRFHETGEAPIVHQRLELTALHRSGREFPIEITITSPMRLENGYFFGAFLRDISDRREHDDQLRRAKESAEAATRAKSEFLANMSHELRTPLNGVLGYAQLLQRDRSLSASQRGALDAISRCGAHLLDLINDILDLSKIEAGRVDIEAASTDLVQLTHDLKYVVGEAARRRGLSLTMAIAPDVPRRVVLDGRHLRQVLLNLLGNAIKFTERGGVRLTITRADGDRLAFDVIDTGIGIEPEALKDIFEAFTQTDAGAAAGGTGLGLTISHHLIKSMGDELRVESVPGQGSRFFFALPLVRGEAPESVTPDVELAAPPLDARLAAGRRAHRARRRRQHREPPHPRQPSRERGRAGDYGGRRARGDSSSRGSISPT